MSQTPSVPLLTTPDGRQQLLACYRDGLLKDTLPFWFPRCIDSEHGGFVHCLDQDGSVLDTDKSVWAQGRMSWMLLSLYNASPVGWDHCPVRPKSCAENVAPENLASGNLRSGQMVPSYSIIANRPEWLQWAESGLAFLDQHCFDLDGRMFFHVTREGQPIRKRRYAYSEAFAAIAFASHYKATGNHDSAKRAKELFDFFTRWNFTPGLMPPKFTETRPLIGLGPRMITIVTAQELRFNLGDDPKYTEWIDRCIDEIQRWFVKPEQRVVMESVAPNGDIVDHFDGRLLNPGHAIEGAWFIMQEGKLRNDSRLIQLSCDMLDWMWERGWDAEFGGLFYFRDLLGKPVQEYWQDMKFWWPHDEAIIATLMAFELTGNEKYARWHQQVHDWSHQYFADSKNGEWFGYLHRDGRPATTTKGNLWKSFFHHPRMQWMCVNLLNQ